MSGFVVAYGSPDLGEVEAMFRRIRHRGPYFRGIASHGDVIMAQNYLKADGPPAEGEIPLVFERDGATMVCYDGQMGNWGELAARRGIPDGPLREERLVLDMYDELGAGMLEYMGDAVFSLVISDGGELFAARDLLGIKTLFYGVKDSTIYLSSELKAVVEATGEVYEFPAGHYMESGGRLVRFAQLPTAPPENMRTDVEEMTGRIRDILSRSFKGRVDFSEPTGSLLSGGIDSSVIAALASEAYREKFGSEARLKTFALGVGESEDIQSARLVARHIGSEHHELMVGLDEMIEVLPEVIYHLENFDPSLVRSAIANFLISRYAKGQGVDVLLSGEGGDEVFCGYGHLKSVPPEDLFEHQVKCLGFLHSNASLRLDRMNACNSIRVVTPLISGELLEYSFSIAPEYKMRPDGEEKIEKWIFRKAFEDALPAAIVWRNKQEFSQGSGSAAVLPEYFEDKISDEEFAGAQARDALLRSKEELYYFRIFREHFGTPHAVETVGQWLNL